MAAIVQDLDSLLAASSATEPFKQAVLALREGRKTDSIVFNGGSPPVKVLRAISKLLEVEPSAVIDQVEVQGTSGCGDFTGRISVNGGEKQYQFIWDCAWKAKQEKLVDAWGMADQMRAAREFGYQCFEKFEQVDK